MIKQTKAYRRKVARDAAKITATAASKKYHLGTQTVRAWMKEFGVHRTRETIAEASRLAIKAVKGGMSINEASREYDLNASNLKVKLNDHEEFTGLHPCVLMLDKARRLAA